MQVIALMIIIALIGASMQIMFHEWLKVHYRIKLLLGINPFKTFKPIDCERCMSFWFTVLALVLIECFNINVWYLTPFLVPLVYKILIKLGVNDNN